MSQYVLKLCDRIAAMTDVPGETTRLFLSPATRKVHALLTAEMEALGMTVRTDAIGNLRGMYAGTKASPWAETLLVGSHIDTVPDAGRYDGVLGVALALGMVRALGGARLSFAIEVIAFSEEEGVRFRLPFLGSRALVGTLGAAELERVDDAGVSVADAVSRFDLVPAQLADAVITPGTFAFFEPHLEQGPILEAAGLGLGVVASIAGQTRLSVTFQGLANHAGTTPMRFRSDALMAAAQWMVAVETLARETPGLVATVGMVRVLPGAVNIIPGEVAVSLDVRHAENKVRVQAVRKLIAKAESIAQYRSMEVVGSTVKREVRVSVVETSVQASVAMDGRLVQMLDSACAGQALRMTSGAGHDAMILAAAVPSAMLFLRTPGGLSHHPDEAVLAADVEAALQVGMRFPTRA